MCARETKGVGIRSRSPGSYYIIIIVHIINGTYGDEEKKIVFKKLIIVEHKRTRDRTMFIGRYNTYMHVWTYQIII